jgi:NAD(P)-dependent dehydrogenase (short-subunit alcohol dehydrogenase family)
VSLIITTTTLLSDDLFRRTFSKAGYTIALIARGSDAVKQLADELNASGGEVCMSSSFSLYFIDPLQATGFPVESYTPENISSVWKSIHKTYAPPNYHIRAAIFNAGKGAWKPFLEITQEDLRESLAVNVEAAFAFSREAILAFKQNEIEEPKGARGSLIFTGATASLRGNTTTSAFAAGKFGLRALSQSLGKEFWKDNIHVSLGFGISFVSFTY